MPVTPKRVPGWRAVPAGSSSESFGWRSIARIGKYQAAAGYIAGLALLAGRSGGEPDATPYCFAISILLFLSRRPRRLAARPHHRLIHEKSPYLLQHAHTRWIGAWGQEAFDEAKAAEEPIFLSVGYSTCHCCHGDGTGIVCKTKKIAAILNENFICIKVDREEASGYRRNLHGLRGVYDRQWRLADVGFWLTPDLKPLSALVLSAETAMDAPASSPCCIASLRPGTRTPAGSCGSGDKALDQLAQETQIAPGKESGGIDANGGMRASRRSTACSTGSRRIRRRARNFTARHL